MVSTLETYKLKTWFRNLLSEWVNLYGWVCELPTTKRVLKGHVVEAPCQLCLWGSTH